MARAVCHQFIVTEDRVPFHVVHMRFVMDKIPLEKRLPSALPVIILPMFHVRLSTGAG